MARLKDFEIEISLIPSGKIIAYKADYALTVDEFHLLPKIIQEKFSPIHKQYNCQYYKNGKKISV